MSKRDISNKCRLLFEVFGLRILEEKEFVNCTAFVYTYLFGGGKPLFYDDLRFQEDKNQLHLRAIPSGLRSQMSLQQRVHSSTRQEREKQSLFGRKSGMFHTSEKNFTRGCVVLKNEKKIPPEVLEKILEIVLSKGRFVSAVVQSIFKK